MTTYFIDGILKGVNDMGIQRDQLATNLSNAKRGYDKLYLDITVEVIQKMIADAVAKGDKKIVKQLDGTLKLVVADRDKYDKL
tara:strand:- start:305 stop:553 length:249 start_codon:yes stop_codon:yes gene_type:complete